MHIEINPNIQLFLLTSIALIALPHFNHLSIFVFGYFYFLLVWRFIVIKFPKLLPNKFVLLLLIAFGALILYREHHSMLGRDAGTSLFMIALALKLMEIHQERDLYLVVYLAFIVAASQFLFEQNIFMAGYILLVCCVLLGTLITLNSPKLKMWSALKNAAVILAQALPLAIVLFILFPRVDAPRWMLFQDRNTAKTGLSDSMEPGSISQLGLSDELVFRVKFDGVIPPNQLLYWRGPVLSLTDGKRWTQSKADLNYQSKPLIKYSGRPYHYKIMLEPQVKNWVYALEMPAEIPPAVNMSGDYQILSRDNPDQRTEYRFSSYPGYDTGKIQPDVRQINLQLPASPSNQIKKLVKRLRGFDSGPEVFVQNVMNHFRQQNFSYTLMPPLMEEKPIETFLFETRTGFCSHYAAAFTYLMRVAGVPARVVTGYQGGELNKVGRFLEIRQANAHAWTEVWLQDKGWVRVDPTSAIAPERIEQSLDIARQIASGAVSFVDINNPLAQKLNWLKQASQLWNNIDYNWNRWVINYNSANQARFLSSLGIDNIKSMLYWLLAIITLITAILSWILLRKKHQTVDKIMGYYNRFCRQFAKKGYYRKNSEGPLNFADRMIIHFPEHNSAIVAITELFIKLRYTKNKDQNDLHLFIKKIGHFKLK